MRSLKALAARLGCPANGEYLFDRAVIDSRDIRTGSLFFALSGRKTDGHNYVADVLGAGGAAVVSRDGFTGAVLEVDSVEEALLEAGSWARDSMDFPIVGITGSSGKTTTRRMTAAALACEYITSETSGNLNNHLGLPITLLNTPQDTEFLVLEMGMNHPGELLRLGWASRPSHALITNIGRAHMEFFQSLEDVAHAKSELLQTTEPGGIALIPEGDPILRRAAEDRELQVFTHGPGGDYWVDKQTAMPWEIELDLKYSGEHSLRNALCAMAFAEQMGVDPLRAAEAVSMVEPASGRGEVLRIGNRRVVDESYNANPDSTEACLRSVAAAYPPPLVALLGDMLELGEGTDEYHRKMLSLADQLGFKKKITVGRHYRQAAEALGTSGCMWTDTWTEALELLRSETSEGCTILVKGSNSMGLWNLVQRLKREGF